MIEKAMEKTQVENVRFSTADLTKHWPCENESYDLVTCNLVLEHIENLSHVFLEAARVLIPGGIFLVNELHPFKQYLGTKARFEQNGAISEVDAFVHHISDFIKAATVNGLKMEKLDEFWHEEDANKPPRIVSFIFHKE